MTHQGIAFLPQLVDPPMTFSVYKYIECHDTWVLHAVTVTHPFVFREWGHDRDAIQDCPAPVWDKDEESTTESMKMDFGVPLGTSLAFAIGSMTPSFDVSG